MDTWPAKDLLKPLWLQHGGRKTLSEHTGISEGHLSKVNGGKAPLTLAAARVLAEVLDVSLLELGAPEATADDPKSQTLLARLTELAEGSTLMAEKVRALEERIALLEARPLPGQARRPRAKGTAR